MRTMKYISISLVILFGCLIMVTCLNWDEEEMVKRGNNYVDKLLHEMIIENGDSFDPYLLDDKVVSFHKKLVLTNLTGDARLYNGSLKGLKTLHRTDYSILREMEDHLIVVAQLGANDLELRYFGSVKLNNRGPTINVRAVADFIKVTMTMQVDSSTGRNGKLIEFKVHEIQQIHVWIHGLGPLSWALTSLTGAITGIFKTYVNSLIEKQIKAHIAKKMIDYQFPLADLNYFLV